MDLHIALCDDMAAEAEHLRRLVACWAESNGHTPHIAVFPSAEAFLFAYAEQKTFDILLLDIQMGDMNGVELARQIREDNEDIQLLFITGYPDFMAEGYEVSALHYLMKPVNEDRLGKALDRALRPIARPRRVLLVPTDGETLRLPMEDILYAESFAHDIALVTRTGTVRCRQSMVNLEDQLGNAFVRCHRSYLAGLAHIRQLGRSGVVLDNGQVLPLSRRMQAEVQQAFIRFHHGEEE